MPFKYVVEKIEEIAENLRDEYELRDGKYWLKIDGDIPEVEETKAKVAEFRDNNITLMKERDQLKTTLKSFEGIDPKEYKKLKEQVEAFKSGGVRDPADIEARIQARVAPLEAQLTEMERKRVEAEEALARQNLRSRLTQIGVKAGVDEKALPDFLARGLQVFNLEGQAMDGEKPLFSKKKPAEKLGMEEWAADLLQDAPHLFKISRGGGTGGARPSTDSSNRRIISGADPLEFGKNLEEIAKGNVVVSR